MADTFYTLQKITVKKVKEVLQWAYDNNLHMEVDELNCKKSFCRKPSEKTFEQILPLIDSKSAGFFGVIHRRHWNAFPLLSNTLKYIDVLDFFIRGIDVGDTEYFFFIFVSVEKLEYLTKKFKLKEIT
jgi:hypothetical protein